jgi:hypothetical protein
MAKRTVWVVESRHEDQRQWKPDDSIFYWNRKLAVEEARKMTAIAKDNGWKSWQSRAWPYDARKERANGD